MPEVFTVGLTLTVTNASSCSATNSTSVPNATQLPDNHAVAGTGLRELHGQHGEGTGQRDDLFVVDQQRDDHRRTERADGPTPPPLGQTVGLTLTVTNASSCSATNSTSVPINANPTPTITPPNQVCANSTGNTAKGSDSATSYSWSISNGTIINGQNAQIMTYTAGASGSVGLTLTVMNGSCSASNSTSVPINANPTPTITALSPVNANSTGNTASDPDGAASYASAATTPTPTTIL